MNDCIGLMGKIFGHSFKARYDESAKLNPENQPESHITLALGAQALESSKDCISVYKGDVCTRCGKVINQPKD